MNEFVAKCQRDLLLQAESDWREVREAAEIVGMPMEEYIQKWLELHGPILLNGSDTF